MDFDKVRWKLADDLTPAEADLIIANKDKLNDEEKAAFADLITTATPLPNDPLEDQLEKAGEPDTQTADTQVTTTAQATNDTTTPAAPVAPQIPENVVTQDKLDTYIEGKRKEWEAEGKTKAEQEKEEEKITKLFDEGFAPKDWNDFAIQYLDKAAPIIEQRILAKLDKQNKELADNQNKIRQTQSEIFQRFENEFSELAKNKLIPDPTANPDEYKKIHDQIIAIGDAHGKATVTDAYKLWSIIPVEKGGGFGTNAETTPDPKAKIEAQKEAAGKIGSGRGAPGAQKPGTPQWANIHSTRMEDLIEQRLRQP